MNKIIYWISTSLLVLFVGVFSVVDLLPLAAVQEATKNLGFPLYVLPLFGTLKILGTMCIVIPGLKRFREAAYAGIFYFFAGAVYAHLANGDDFKNTLVPSIVLIISMVSYFSSRKKED